VWVHLTTVLNILPRFWIWPTFQGHRGQTLKSRANLAFWRCPIDILWMDWLRSFKFGVDMYSTNISAKFDVGWIRVQNGRLAAILFQKPKSPAYESWIVIACGWMHLTTLLNILCKFLIWLTFQGHRGQHVKKVVQTWQFDDVRSISFEQIDWQASSSVGEMYYTNICVKFDVGWSRSQDGRLANILFQNPKSQKQCKNYQFYALSTVRCGILTTVLNITGTT
jgi:hypothetical protein